MAMRPSPVIPTQRWEHVGHLAERVKGLVRNVMLLKGGMGKKKRQPAAEEKRLSPTGRKGSCRPGRYIGEVFDDAHPDPLSWPNPYPGR